MSEERKGSVQEMVGEVDNKHTKVKQQKDVLDIVTYNYV